MFVLYVLEVDIKIIKIGSSGWIIAGEFISCYSVEKNNPAIAN